MTQYDKAWPWLRYLIAPEKLEHILANVFTELEFKNLRVAESEKYAHVTYFFNGGIEKPFAGEERVMVPSPKVPTYDLKPEMSAAGVADTVVHAIEKGDFDAIIMNFANADMVGTLRQARSDDQSRRNRGRMPRPHLSGAATARRSMDYHRRPRQRRNHDRSHYRRIRTLTTPQIPCRSFCSPKTAAPNSAQAARYAISRPRCWGFWT